MCPVLRARRSMVHSAVALRLCPPRSSGRLRFSCLGSPWLWPFAPAFSTSAQTVNFSPARRQRVRSDWQSVPAQVVPSLLVRLLLEQSLVDAGRESLRCSSGGSASWKL